MDHSELDDLAGDPRFIPGVFNYCDRWCERCPFTARCLNYAIGQEMESGNLPARDAENETFWDKLHETFESTMEMIEDEAEETDFDLDEEELQQSMREQEEVHEAAQAQPYSQTALRYIDIVDGWLKANEGLVGDKSEEPKSSLPADLRSVGPGDAAGIRDCLEVILWYQRQIYVKLCRAASGTIRAEGDELDSMQDDADGSAKVALIGIERSMGAWATLLGRFPDHEDIIFALGTLKRLLRQVEAAFPNARTFRRPGFDTGARPSGE